MAKVRDGTGEVSSNILDDATRRLARRLRAERERRGWSLTELAARSGVSRAMVHRVERAESSPTAMVLGRLSGAFAMTMSELLAEPATDASRVARAGAGERKPWVDPATGYRRETITAPRLPADDSDASSNGTGSIDIVRVTMPPGQRADFPESAYGFLRQCIWVQDGSLTFHEGERTWVLGPDDCLTLGAPAACAFVNASDAPCTYVVVVARR